MVAHFLPLEDTILKDVIERQEGGRVQGEPKPLHFQKPMNSTIIPPAELHT